MRGGKLADRNLLEKDTAKKRIGISRSAIGKEGDAQKKKRRRPIPSFLQIKIRIDEKGTGKRGVHHFRPREKTNL